ncbi:MAG: hypothetical protein JW702_05375 [Clostridiales bacterium]|nr:hypothetical protein [Clostridiales bacterium]
MNHQDIIEKVEFIDWIKETQISKEIKAFGVMFLDKEKKYIDPLVHVVDTDTTIWERGCGSGSIATAVVLASENCKNFEFDIHQPGGTLKVKMLEDKIIICSDIKIVAKGTIYING